VAAGLLGTEPGLMGQRLGAVLPVVVVGVVADARSSANHPADSGAGGGDKPHNFDAQKQEHQRIRNDPDYDDWEYGTEPLPHEAWLSAQRAAGRNAAAGPDAASA